MSDTPDVCPRCGATTGDHPRYQCVRCFSLYCHLCPESNGGQLCPKCAMPQRIVHRAEKTGAPGK